MAVYQHGEGSVWGDSLRTHGVYVCRDPTLEDIGPAFVEGSRGHSALKILRVLWFVNLHNEARNFCISLLWFSKLFHFFLWLCLLFCSHGKLLKSPPWPSPIPLRSLEQMWFHIDKQHNSVPKPYTTPCKLVFQSIWASGMPIQEQVIPNTSILFYNFTISSLTQHVQWLMIPSWFIPC